MVSPFQWLDLASYLQVLPLFPPQMPGTGRPGSRAGGALGAGGRCSYRSHEDGICKQHVIETQGITRLHTRTCTCTCTCMYTVSVTKLDGDLGWKVRCVSRCTTKSWYFYTTAWTTLCPSSHSDTLEPEPYNIQGLVYGVWGAQGFRLIIPLPITSEE